MLVIGPSFYLRGLSFSERFCEGCPLTPCRIELIGVWNKPDTRDPTGAGPAAAARVTETWEG